MELTATPHRPVDRRRRPVLVGLVLLLLLGVTGLVLAPLALGLHHTVVHDAAMGSTWRGAVAIEEVKPGRDLGVGDVITFVVPDPPADRETVTRRVVSVVDGIAMTRADETRVSDPWLLRLDESSYSRIIVRAPYAGRLLAGYRPLVLVVLLGVLATLAMTRGRRADAGHVV